MIISSNEIHMWYAYDETIHDSYLISQYHTVLNEKERLQYGRFHFEKHRHQYLITRAMVKSVLSLYESNIAPDKWEFESNDHGKPFISNASLITPLCFNISHTEKIVVMAVALNQEVGVDVEYLPRAGKMLDIASSFFSSTEAAHLFSLPLDKQPGRFFDLWTLKEAYIKACGMGLSIPLDHFSYSFSQQGKISIKFNEVRNDQPELWQFWQIHPNDKHKVAMALKNDEANINFSISMREIIPLSTVSEVSYPIAHGHIIRV